MENTSLDRKLDEFIVALESANLDSASKRKIQQRLNAALKISSDTSEAPTDHLQQFFSDHKTDTRAARKRSIAKTLTSIIRMITALLLVCLGFGMIIMPAPPYFEMFTIFTIPGSNGNDGVTIMDVISLIIAFAGISLFISSVIKFNK